jgi:hypothetical protein
MLEDVSAIAGVGLNNSESHPHEKRIARMANEVASHTAAFRSLPRKPSSSSVEKRLLSL